MTLPSSSDDDVLAQRRRLVNDAQDAAEWRQGLITASPESPEDGSPESLAVAGEDEAWLGRHWSSRALHRLGEATTHAAAGLTAAGAVLAWLAVGGVTGFPDWWETVLYAASASVTLVMVFAIQHTQARQQSATQRKLDELLRAQPSADNALIAVEEAPDQELEARATLNLADRRAEPLEDGHQG